MVVPVFFLFFSYIVYEKMRRPVSPSYRLSSGFRIVAGLTASVAMFFFISGCTAGTEEAITASELESHVRFLASDALHGRYTGTPGVAAAEAYIAEAFSSLGLLPLPGEEDFFLEFKLKSFSYDFDATRLVVNDNAFALGEGFRPFPFSDDGDVEGEVVFCRIRHYSPGIRLR